VSDPERQRRFIQEAQAASALNHPNIVTVHEITAENGTFCIVMEYVPGKPLDEMIPRYGSGHFCRSGFRSPMPCRVRIQRESFTAT
jgi:serine/threonine-protein kinase